MNPHELPVISFLERLEGKPSCSSMEEGGPDTPQVDFGGKGILGVGINQSSLVHARMEVFLGAV